MIMIHSRKYLYAAVSVALTSLAKLLLKEAYNLNSKSCYMPVLQHRGKVTQSFLFQGNEKLNVLHFMNLQEGKLIKNFS